jgi:hypothetical protein
MFLNMNTGALSMNTDCAYFLRIAGKYLEQLNEQGCPLFLAEERNFWIALALREFMQENCV